MRRLLFLLPLLAFASLVIWFVFGLERDPRLLPSVMIDKPVPVFNLPPLPGFDQGLASSDLTGQPQLVNVFASWCASCRVEQGLLVELARQTKIPINGLNWKDKPEDAVAWLKQYGNPFSRIGSDLSGRVAIDWGVYGAPETYVIDAQGRIRYRHVGPLTPQDVQQKLLPLIQQLKG